MARSPIGAFLASFGGGPPILNPVSVANLAAYYKYNTGITQVANAVSQWNDQTVNARHLVQAVGANQPILQADGTILFDGIAHFLKTAPFALNQPETIYFVGRQVSWTAGEDIFAGNGDNQMNLRQTVAAGGSPFISLNSGTDNSASNSDFTVNAYAVVIAVYNSPNCLIQVNRGTPTTGDSGVANGGGFTLGRQGTTAVRFSNIQVKEIAIYNAAHDAAQRAALLPYFLSLL